MKPYADRRAAVIARMQEKGGGVAIIPTAPEAARNSDADYPYRHDSYFYYLSGFTEPEAVIVLVAGPNKAQSILFCREKNLEREIWDGFRYGPEAAGSLFHFDQAFSIAELDKEMGRLLADAPAIYYGLGSNARLEADVTRWLQQVRRQARGGITAPAVAHDLHTILNEMRLFKDPMEVSIMQRAANISAEAHCRAMRFTKPGAREYQIEAELLYEFRKMGSEFPAYTSIVAAGANACVLHYRAGNAVAQDGDLVLIDAGCELESYASDITRTYPANGRFTAPQQTLYEIVLAAQHAAFEQTVPGKPYNEAHDAAVRVLAQGMLDTGLLDRNKVGSLEDVLASKAYTQFYMHRTGHWLGLDVHDVGQYREPGAPTPPEGQEKPWRKLQPGMVLTVEPGIYVRPGEGVPEQFWNIGIRIEDDVLLTPDGHRVLTSNVPTAVDEIHALMQEQHKQ